jgi:hypothetical protein
MNDAPSRERSRRSWPFALGVFALVAGVLLAVVPLASAHLSGGEGNRGELRRLDAVFGPWVQFDGGWYWTIAEDGYSDVQVDRYNSGDESAVAFYPGYPLTVRAVEPAFGDTGLALVGTTFIAGAALAVVFDAWCRRRQTGRASRLTMIALFVFPYAFYLVGASYGDALFLLATVGAFLLLEDDRPALAGLAGAVATATRPVGVAVVVGLVVLVLQRRGGLTLDRRLRFDHKKLRRRDAAVLLAGTGVGGFMAFQWVRFGSPFASSIAQRGWDQELSVRTVLKYRFFDHVLHDPRPDFVLRLTIGAVLLVVFLAAVPAVWRRFGAAYGLYTAIVLALPAIGDATFIGVGRYVLAAFPVFALFGDWLSRQSRERTLVVLATSGLGLVFMASLYGRSFFVA